ncbi:ATP-binding protein [Microbispora siamensis]
MPGSGDEIAALARTVNATLDRLENAVRQHKRFVADAAHELRSPIATVRTRLELASRHAPAREALAGALLEVRDDGPGIPPEDREAVFDRFTRLDDARTRDAGGSGLGLAIVREIAARHGGTVVIGDSPGGGACFTVRLPISRADPR